MFLLFLFIFPLLAYCDTTLSIREFSQWSLNRFDARVSPYHHLDNDLAFSYNIWIDDHRNLGSFINLNPSYSTSRSDDILSPQDFLQTSFGFQYYPFFSYLNPITHPILKSFRCFSYLGYRIFPHKNSSKNEHINLSLGIDFTYDNYFSDHFLFYSLYSSLTYDSTSFSSPNPVKDYEVHNTLRCFGRFCFGLHFISSNIALIPYVLSEWSCGLLNDSRWLSNYCDIGSGIRIYPHFNSVYLINNRFYFFSEIALRIFEPYPSPDEFNLKHYDLRFGISFTTPDFFKESPRY